MKYYPSCLLIFLPPLSPFFNMLQNLREYFQSFLVVSFHMNMWSCLVICIRCSLRENEDLKGVQACDGEEEAEGGLLAELDWGWPRPGSLEGWTTLTPQRSPSLPSMLGPHNPKATMLAAVRGLGWAEHPSLAPGGWYLRHSQNSGTSGSSQLTH